VTVSLAERKVKPNGKKRMNLDGSPQPCLAAQLPGLAAPAAGARGGNRYVAGDSGVAA
jgi:hypothetical protein